MESLRVNAQSETYRDGLGGLILGAHLFLCGSELGLEPVGIQGGGSINEGLVLGGTVETGREGRAGRRREARGDGNKGESNGKAHIYYYNMNATGGDGDDGGGGGGGGGASSDRRRGVRCT